MCVVCKLLLDSSTRHTVLKCIHITTYTQVVFFFYYNWDPFYEYRKNCFSSWLRESVSFMFSSFLTLFSFQYFGFGLVVQYIFLSHCNWLFICDPSTFYMDPDGYNFFSVLLLLLHIFLVYNSLGLFLFCLFLPFSFLSPSSSFLFLL